MKLLLVDDEKLTRDGILNSIPWDKLGITQVKEAVDGAHGLELARSFQPDIVLSDVRMPHLTGIEMAKQLQKQNPDLVLIFMSGYSDKQYLKAAIRLKAVSYVEKPIDIEELTEVLREACENVKEVRKTAQSKALSVSKEQGQLAWKLTTATKVSLKEIQENMDLPKDSPAYYFTIIVQLHRKNTMPTDTMETVMIPIITKVLEAFSLKEIHGNRLGYLYIFHVWGSGRFVEYHKNQLGEQLIKELKPSGLRYHFVFGKNVACVQELHNSYNSAVIELQNSFFDRENTFRIYKHVDSYEVFPDLEQLGMEERLRKNLLQRDAAGVNTLMEELFEELLRHRTVLPNQVKDFYYKLFLILRENCQLLQISLSERGVDAGIIWDSVSDSESLYELHDLLTETCGKLFPIIQKENDSQSTVYLVKEFIATHFQNEALSIKDISDYVMRSSSYVCTLFKNETGLTLNQYLTEYRMEQAKKLLASPQYKITDICGKVGYSDGSYFGKIFKKTVGMSPSEYREQKL